MKFELAQMVAVADTEEVLRVLEVHLRLVAAEVVRSNGQITAYGIGPSPRTVNRRDTMVVEAAGVDGSTRLTANVNYQASALLGNSPQNEIVRAKIEGALDEMRAELKRSRPWAPPLPLTEPVGTGPAETLVELVAIEPVKSETAAVELKAIEPVAIATESIKAVAVESVAVETKRTETKAVKTEAQPASEAAVPAEPMANRPMGRQMKVYQGSAERRTGPQRAFARSGEVHGASIGERRWVAPLDEAPLKGLLRTQGVEARDEGAGRGWKVALSVVASVLLVGGMGYGLRDQLPEPWQTTIAEWSKQVRETLPVLGMARSAAAASDPAGDTVPAKGQAARVAIVSDPAVAVKPERNIYLWVQDWAAALRSRDPAAQASYYAETVNEYLTQSGVSREFVMQDKTANIGGRGPLWSVKVDHIYVQNLNSTGAQLKVMKHLLSTGPAGEPVVTVVKTQLKVIRVDETWQIVEELEIA